MDSFVGKTLTNDKGESFVILNQLYYKSILCCYAMKVMENDVPGEEKFFQIIDNKLMDIGSKKMISMLNDLLFKQNENNNKPRKIKENESIESYFAYLDDYYKKKVVAII